MKRLIGIILSIIVVIYCASPISVEAKVIEPEVVKTESWTTSYYIDDDMDTLYPYIQCEADIYNDGTIKLYMWNTHEWDGFTTIKHKITLCNTDLTCYIDYNDYFINYNNSTKTGYFPNDYYFPEYADFGSSNILISGITFSFHNVINEYYWYAYEVALPTWETSSVSSGSPVYSFYPTSTVDFSKPQYFRLFGHDITITPELLSGNIIAEPELTDQEKRINELETKVLNLEKQLEAYQAFDFDSDDLLTAADAQMILTYYVEYLAGNNNGSVSGYSDFVKSRGE